MCVCVVQHSIELPRTSSALVEDKAMSRSQFIGALLALALNKFTDVSGTVAAPASSCF